MRTPISHLRLAALHLVGLCFSMSLQAQPTTITTGNTLLQSPVKRLGINLGGTTSYDSAQYMKNLVYDNPGFEGEIYHSIIRCLSATATSCSDDNWYSGWPTNFWNGATFEFIYGTAAGRTGTITSYTAATGSAGGLFTFSNTGVTPALGDYMIVRMNVPGNASAGWQPAVTGAATITTDTLDLPPGTTGKQALAMTAPAAGDYAILKEYFDGTAGISFVQINGNYQLSFKAKGVAGSKTVAVNLFRYGTNTAYLNQTVNLSTDWATYTLNFSGAEVGGAVGTVQLSFAATGPDAYYLDDVSLVQLNSDPTNTTVFRDPVVNALKALNPGVMRFWANQLGDSLDNLLSDPGSRQRAAYSPWTNEVDYISYSLHEFLQLCETIGAEPWFVVPTTFSTAEASNLIDYLAGSTSTPYGAKRAALGHPTPWTTSMSKIHLEFGNENWNSSFKGGIIEYSEPYGARAQTMFGVMRSTASFVAASFDLVLGGQAVSPGRNQGIQSSCNNNDSFAVAPYLMSTVDAYSNNEDLFGSTFAEAEAFVVPTGQGEGQLGLMLQNQAAMAATSHPVPLVTYETNMGTVLGSITQTALNNYESSVGAGIAVVDSMLQQMRIGVITQNLFTLGQYIFHRTDGKSAYIWGAVVDMGVSDRRRPQFHGMAMVNKAIGNNAVMLRTVHTGANPTWDQPTTNLVQLNGAHYLQSFAFLGSSGYSLVLFNLHRTSSLAVNFAGANVPNGTVQIQQLTSANITDTNETANLVLPTNSSVSSFNAATGVSLPPYSMTVYTWAAPAKASPLISAVNASGITTTTATVTWTTDQSTTTQVAYGTTSAYGSLSPVVSALTTSHSVTLTGLNPGVTYNFAAISGNSAGTISTSDNFTFQAQPLPAPQISGVAASNITPTSATFTWTTDQAATSQVQYGLTNTYGATTTLNSALVTTHTASVTGLTQNTTYNFSALSANSAGTLSNSANYTFQTPVTPAVISAVTATNIAANSVTVNWTTDQPSSTQVQFGTTAAYGFFSGANNTLVTAHSVTFGNLTANTTYNYSALSTNALGATATSANFTFTTALAPPVLSGTAVTNVTTTGATISWTTDQPSNTQVAYGTSTAYGSLSTANPALVTSHTVTLSNLTASTLYNVQAMSTNSAGAQGLSQNVTLTTTTPPTVISALAASAITANGATITWTTDQPASSQVQYGTTTAYGGLSSANSSLVTAHTVTLVGLTAGTTYNFSAFSANSAGTLTTSPNATFATAAPPAVITAIAVTAVTTTGATITWSTDLPATTQLQYGTTTSYGATSTLNSALTTSHTVTLTGLAQTTLYNFAVLATTGSGAQSTSANFNFTTGTPPAVITNLSASSITTTGATITWSTDQPSTSQVEFGTTTAYGALSTANSSLFTFHTVSLGGLTPGTTYNYAALSFNAGGTQTTSANATFTTQGSPVPPVITAVTASNVTPNTATITWTTDQPATSQVEFGATTSYGGLSTANSSLVTSHTVALSGLSAGTTYNYATLSANGNAMLATSANFTFTTTASQLPPVISAVAATGVTSTAVTINWTTDQPSTSQVEFGTTSNYGSFSTANSSLVTSHSVSITNLSPGITYNFAVLSQNAALVLATSTNFTFTTSTVGNPAPVITAVTATAVTNSSAIISWTTDQASTSQVQFGTTSSYGSLSTADSSFITAHSVTIAGLSPSTTYNYAALSSNNLGILGTSTNFTFTTSAAPVPAVITSLIATSISSSTAIITWTTDQPTTSQVEFGTTPSYGGLSTANSSLVTAHSVTLTGLTSNTTYNYAALSANGAATLTTSANFTFNTTITSAPVISAVTINPISTTSATITWTTDITSSSQVFYGLTAAYGLQSTLNPALTLTHTVTLTGLTPGTMYNFDVASANSAGTTATTPNYSFTTTAGGPPPVITSVTASNITSTSATITWTTDLASSSLVNFGTSTAYGSQATDATLVTSHSITLTGLTAGTLYNYNASSTTSVGATATSANFTFSAATLPPPVISAVAAWPVGDNTASILWTTDVVATSQVKYGLTTAYGSQVTVNSSLGLYHVVPLSGLLPGTTYNYQVITANASGAIATSGNNSFTTSGTPPPTITAITVTGITATAATINWTTNQPATTQVLYGTTAGYGSQTTVNSALVTAHSVTLTGLTAGATYNFAALSANSTGTTTTSPNTTFTTTGGSPAPVISAVNASGLTPTSATITWTTDVTSTSLVNYGTTTAYGTQSALNSSLVTTHTVVLTGLTPGTTYNYDVVSANGTGNSATSANFTFATTAAPAPVITAVTASTISSTSATITWTTDQTASSLVNYGTTTVYGTQSTLNSTLVATHTVVLTGLTPSTTYNYNVVSANSAGTPGTSANFTFATTVAPAPVITAVTASSINSTSATVTWTTDQTSSSLVNYGTTAAYGAQSTLNPALTTAHTVTLTGLTAGTTYNFDVVSANSAGTLGTSANYTFATTAAPAPVISAVTASAITQTGATITWTTDQTSSSLANYGATTAYGTQSTLNPALTTAHTVTLTGLTAGTTYNFDVVSANSAGTPATSANFTFVTTAAPAAVITSVAATSITSTGVTITWTTDQTASTQVKYGTTTAYGTQSTLNAALTTSHTVTLTGLTPSTSYNYAVMSTNGSGTPATSANFTFATIAAPPPVITAVASSSISSTSATITWTTDQTASSLVNYGTTTAYGTQSTLNPALLTTHTVTLTGLTPSTSYNYDVVSANSAGTTGTSANFTFATIATPAPVITNVTASGITQTGATITWTTDQTSSSLVNYGTTAAYGTQSTLNPSLVTTHSVTLSGLTAGTTYNYDVISANSAGTPATSANFTFATAAIPAPVITNVTASGITQTGATITWTTDQTASTQVKYGTTTAYGTQSTLNPALTTTHTVTLTGLNPSTTYNYAAQSTNGTSTTATSANFTFVTSAAPAPVITAVASSSITTSSATITWTTDQTSSSLVNYGTTAAYGTQSTLNSALVTAHTVTLSGLTPGTTYNYDVVSVNSAGTPGTSANFTFATTAPPAPVITAVTATSITSSGATITWTTDQTASTQVKYGTTTAYGTQSTLISALVTAHTVTLSGLAPSTTYNYAVMSTNGTSTTATSANFTFTTAAPVAGPNVTNFAYWGVTGSGVVIAWSTDQSADTAVEFGTTTALGQVSPVQTALSASHGVTLNGLNGGTTYYFRGRSTNAAGGIGYSAIFSITTLDTAAPIVTNIVATPAAGNTASVSWTINKPATTQVEYGTSTSYGWWSPQSSGTSTALGWVPSGTIHYRIHSTDALGNSSVTADLTFVEP